jgi:hypothetical protein
MFRKSFCEMRCVHAQIPVSLEHTSIYKHLQALISTYENIQEYTSTYKHQASHLASTVDGHFQVGTAVEHGSREHANRDGFPKASGR